MADSFNTDAFVGNAGSGASGVTLPQVTAITNTKQDKVPTINAVPYTDTAARDAAITAPVNKQTVRTTIDGVVITQEWDGTTWVDISSAADAQGFSEREIITAGKTLFVDDAWKHYHYEGSTPIQFTVPAGVFSNTDKILFTADDPTLITVIAGDALVASGILSTTANPQQFSVTTTTAGNGIRLEFESANYVNAFLFDPIQPSAGQGITPASLNDVSNLILWLDSNNTTGADTGITQLTDRSASGNNANAVTGGEAPKTGYTQNGITPILFNDGFGQTQRYKLDNTVTLDNPSSIHAVVQLYGNPTDEMLLGLDGAGGTSNSLGTFTDAKLRWICDGEAYNSGALISSIDLIADRTYFVELRKTATGREMYIDGVLVASDNSTATFSFNIVGNYRDGDGGLAFEGALYTLAVYDKDTSAAADDNEIKSYFQDTYYGAYDSANYRPQRIVAIDGSKDFTLPPAAANDIPAGVSFAEPNVVKVLAGSYEDTAPIIVKSNVHLVMDSGASYHMNKPNDAAPQDINNDSAADLFANNGRITGGTFETTNGRYGGHFEGGASVSGITHIIENATFIHNGNQGAYDYHVTLGTSPNPVFGAPFAVACGLADNSTQTFTNVTAKGAFGAISSHNAVKKMTAPSFWNATGCTFEVGTMGTTPFTALNGDTTPSWGVRCEEVKYTGQKSTKTLTDCNLDQGGLVWTISGASQRNTSGRLASDNPLKELALGVDYVPSIKGTNSNLCYAGNAVHIDEREAVQAQGIRTLMGGSQTRFNTSLAIRGIRCDKDGSGNVTKTSIRTGSPGNIHVNFGGANPDPSGRELLFGSTATHTRFEGGFGNAPFMFGSVDISGVYEDNGLEHRLGDMSGSPLDFEINTSFFTVILNKDYAGLVAAANLQRTNFSSETAYRRARNQVIIDDINATILGLIAADNTTYPNGTSNIAAFELFEYSAEDDRRIEDDVHTEDYTVPSGQSYMPGQLITRGDGSLVVAWERMAQGDTGKVISSGFVTQATAYQTTRDALTAGGANTNLTVRIL